MGDDERDDEGDDEGGDEGGDESDDEGDDEGYDEGDDEGDDEGGHMVQSVGKCRLFPPLYRPLPSSTNTGHESCPHLLVQLLCPQFL